MQLLWLLETIGNPFTGLLEAILIYLQVSVNI
jgi:hypothetical protein